MANTIEELEAFLKEAGHHCKRGARGAIVLRFATKNYRDPDGDEGLLVLIRLEDDGKYLKIFAPTAFKAVGDHVDVFLRACMMLQWRTKLVQFEYDPDDGEIRPIVEFPLEDAKVTLNQLMRCIHGLAALIDEYSPVLTRALQEGVIEFPSKEDPRVAMRQLLGKMKQSADPADRERVALLETLLASFEGGAPPPAPSGPLTEV